MVILQTTQTENADTARVVLKLANNRIRHAGQQEDYFCSESRQIGSRYY